VSTPIKVKKLGHFVYEVSDIERSTKFWTEILGFHFSDRNEPGMVFLHNATDHHSIALVPSKHKQLAGPESGLRVHHLAMEVDSAETLLRAREFLREHGVPITYEGRRGPGGNIGLEFKDPDGYTFEIYADMDQIGTDGKARPAEQWSRATTLEEALEQPLRSTW
jgi:catechol 2,3-dioxygenase